MGLESEVDTKFQTLGLETVVEVHFGSRVLSLEWRLNFLGPGSWVCLFFIGRLFVSANKK